MEQSKKSMKVEAASQDWVRALEPEVAKVLDALGHPEAFVTDESTVADFAERIFVGPVKWIDTPFGKRRSITTVIDPASFTAAAATLGIAIEPDERIVDVALRLRHLASA